MQGNSQLMIGLFICCHLIGMSSACINPILYGYLNDSFKAQFIEIFYACLCDKKSQPPPRTNNIVKINKKGPVTAKIPTKEEEVTAAKAVVNKCDESAPANNIIVTFKDGNKKKNSSKAPAVVVSVHKTGENQTIL